MHHHGDDGVLREGEEPLISNGGIVMVPANSTNEMWSHPIVGVASPPNTVCMLYCECDYVVGVVAPPGYECGLSGIDVIYMYIAPPTFVRSTHPLPY